MRNDKCEIRNEGREMKRNEKIEKMRNEKCEMTNEKYEMRNVKSATMYVFKYPYSLVKCKMQNER